MAEAVDDIAALWAIRIDARPLSDDETAELDRWLAQNEQHRGALLRAEATLSYLGRAASLAAGDPERSGTAPSRTHSSRRGFIAAIASGALAASIGGLFVTRPWEQRIDTSIGEIRRVPLEDGSVATVNTQSRVQVGMSKSERLVRLSEGEAWFQVAHDPAKPFIVEAGDFRVRAVGTAFSVRLRGGGADVLVTEGQVLAWRAGHADRQIPVKAGFKLHLGASGAGAPVAAEAEIERALAWRSGEIAFDGETLGAAVEEFNRYNRRKLVVDDPGLAREPLVGFFRANEPESFARALGPTMGARVSEQEDRIVISRGG